MSSVRKKRRQKGEDHHQGGQSHANAHQRSELGQSGQAAEIQDQERGNGRDSRPENARRNRVADFRHGQVGMRQSFLVMHHAVIHGQPYGRAGRIDPRDNRHSAVGAYSEHLYHHVGPVLSYALERCLYFMPVLLPLVALAVLVYTMRRRTLALVPLAFPSIIVVFHILPSS